ncbi:MAG: hypothetical protein KF789_02925 [Bdellovibrionaceae bacterium]|nr:hypothetical protein [Pseudobdellovibrionaceae bacterium]
MNRPIHLLIAFAVSIFASSAMASFGGFNLTENGGAFIYDASTDPAKPTEAQRRVLEAQKLGAKHIILNVRATMIGGTSNEIIPVTPPAERAKEAQRMTRLIRFIQAQGMTVGLRPIFFVVGPNGEFPYTEVRPDGNRKEWWHGNIQPSDPDRWFESFRVYLDIYLLIARVAKVDEFTIGAELYSMTVGLEDQWKENPHGFPGRWLELLRYVRSKLPQARLMYDVNFTDDSVDSGTLRKAGGEIERWRYRLVDLANPEDPAQEAIWNDLVSFWTELDAIGIDMYRSLASPRDQLDGLTFDQTVTLLRQRADSYASQLDTILTEISIYTGVDKPVIFKEVGVRSVERGMIDPFTYAGSGVYNEMHQAAGYKALLESLWAPQWPWFAGICFWDLPIDPAHHGPTDLGFSPLGKPQTESVLMEYFLD